jgi:hypothetical protein
MPTNTYTSANNGQTITQTSVAGTIVNSLSTTTAVVPTVTFNTISVGGNFTFNATGGSTEIVNEGVSALGTYRFNANGGIIEATAVVGAASSQIITISNGGTFEAASSFLTLLSSTAVTFGPAVVGDVDTLDIGLTGLSIGLLNITAPIHGFSSTTGQEVIDDHNISASQVATYNITTGPGGNQIVTYDDVNGNSLGSIKFAGGTFSSPDGNYTLLGGPLHLTVGASGELVTSRCFLTGTHIATPDGEVNVETLSIGDQVTTADGTVKSVRWVGKNTVATRFADPLRFMPIRIKAGALGDNVPVRDLLVSPEHAMFIDGVLIHAAALVNGLTIVREQNMPETFVYYHIEVEDHALLMSEGAASESFVDNVDRMAFDNWAEHVELYGEDSSIPEMDYPRAQSARQVPASIRARLSDRADRMLGWSLAQAA